MSTARFEFDVPRTVRLGRPLVGTVTVIAGEAITRAKRLVVTHLLTVDPSPRAGATAPTGEVLHREACVFELPEGGLTPGEHSFEFEIAPPDHSGPTVAGAVEHWLEARLDVAWAVDPVAAIEITVTSSAEFAFVDPTASPSVLVDDEVGPVRFRLIDVVRARSLWIECDFPAELVGPNDDAAFVAAATSGLEAATSVHVRHGRLTAEFAHAADPPSQNASLAKTARETAARICAILEALAFPDWITPEVADAWTAFAREANAQLLPSGPTLWRAPLRAQLQGGGEVVVFATTRTVATAEGLATTVEVDLTTAALPLDANPDEPRAIGHEWIADVRVAFTGIAVERTRAILTARAPSSPRDLVPALDAFLSWVLDVRGMRRETSRAYR